MVIRLMRITYKTAWTPTVIGFTKEVLAQPVITVAYNRIANTIVVLTVVKHGLFLTHASAAPIGEK